MDEIFRLTTLRPHDLSDARAQYRLKAIIQIEQMLGSDDPQELVKIIKDTINFTLQIKDFLSVIYIYIYIIYLCMFSLANKFWV